MGVILRFAVRMTEVWITDVLLYLYIRNELGGNAVHFKNGYLHSFTLFLITCQSTKLSDPRRLRSGYVL